MNPEFSFIYGVTIRRYKSESLFNETTYDEYEALVLANGLREATDKAKDYAEAMSQDGVYKFYDVVRVEELDTVFTGIEQQPSDSAYDFVDVDTGTEEPDWVPAEATQPTYQYLYSYKPTIFPENGVDRIDVYTEAPATQEPDSTEVPIEVYDRIPSCS